MLVACALGCGGTAPRHPPVHHAAAKAPDALHAALLAKARHSLSVAQAEADQLVAQRTQAAADLRQIEARVLAASDRLAAAQAAQARAEAALAAHQAAFSQLLPLVLRLSKYPVETVLAVPLPPDQALQGLLITRGLAATLNREAIALRAQEEAAAALKAQTAQEQATLNSERLRQAEHASSLDMLSQQANSQLTQAEQAAREAAASVAAEAAHAASLPGAVARVEAGDAHKPANAPGPASGGWSGQLVTPVAGRVIHNFGATEADGPATGITYASAPGAFVASPCSGRVAFAAPFRSYGQLIILECGGGYDVVLAGLGRIDTAPGHPVRPGEPLGRMPDQAGNGVFRPSLYVELRSNGRAVNPTPFLNSKG